jgi:hypothetical protein
LGGSQQGEEKIMEGIAIGLASLFWGCVIIVVLFPVLSVIFYSIARWKAVEEAFEKSVIWSFVLSPLGCCILTWLVLSWSFSGPPTPDHEPSVDDISSVYILVSINELRDSGYQQIPDIRTITFLPDGTFIAKNMPDIFFYGNLEKGFHSGSGNWAIYKKYGIDLVFREIDGIATDVKTSLSLYGNKPPYKLYQVLGDELHWLVFEKP